MEWFGAKWILHFCDDTIVVEHPVHLDITSLGTKWVWALMDDDVNLMGKKFLFFPYS